MRAIHFAATIVAAGVPFFIVLVAAPAFCGADDQRARTALWRQLAMIAWPSLGLVAISAVGWLVLIAASMSGQSPADVLSGEVLWTVLLQTEFGLVWTVRLILTCLLAGIFLPLLSSLPEKRSWIGFGAVVFAAALVGTLAWGGHAIGALGLEGVIHPAADVLHLIAAAAWIGMLVPLALVLSAAGKNAAPVVVARMATLRFSTIGVLAVATVLVTGAINTWYLVGSIQSLISTLYGRLLLAKVALFFAMVAVAAVNRLHFTPRFVQSESATTTQRARQRLRLNALIETAAAVGVIGIVAVLGIEPPASHAGHEHAYGALPPDVAFVHIHGAHAMAEVTIAPGHTGVVQATIRLLREDFKPLKAQKVMLSITPPTPGALPTTLVATQNPDGAWQVDGIELLEPGNWTVAVDVVLDPTKRIVLDAPIVIERSKSTIGP
jgi:putative copper resistance protein D